MRALPFALCLLLAACGGVQDAGFAPRDAAAGPAALQQGLRFDTELGSFTAVLYPEAAPQTVARYLEYAESDYFVGRSFGRVIPGFVIQLTDRVLGVTEDERTLPLEASPDHDFSAGALGIARAASPDSGGPEFFVMDFAAAHLNPDYTMWGQVIEGLDVVRQIARVDAIDWSDTTGLPTLLFDRYAIEPVEITAVEVLELSLPPALAAELPRRTARDRLRTDDAAYNLEWPATLAPGQTTTMSFYVTVFDEGAVPPPAESLALRIDGEEFRVRADADWPGIYRFDWTPVRAGLHRVNVLLNNEDLGVLQAVVTN